MGAACGKGNNAAALGADSGTTVGVLFQRFDVNNKGFLSLQDLDALFLNENSTEYSAHFRDKNANQVSELSCA